MNDPRPHWLPTDRYPFELRRLALSGGQCTYVDEGDGPTLLFVHAGLWSFVFRDVIIRLRTGFRCVTLDFPGYGLARAGTHELGLGDLASALGEFVTALDLRDMTIVAHDLGGPVALAMAAGHTERVAGLVLANTFAWTPDQRLLRMMLRLIGGRTAQAIGVTTNLPARLTSTRFGIGRHLSSADRAAFRGPFADRAVRRRFHALLASTLGERQLTDRVERATRTALNDLPVLTIFGERNDPFGFQARHAATFPDHSGIVVAGGNHFPMMDDPDLFATAVRRWHARAVERTAVRAPGRGQAPLRPREAPEPAATSIRAGRPPGSPMPGRVRQS